MDISPRGQCSIAGRSIQHDTPSALDGKPSFPSEGECRGGCRDGGRPAARHGSGVRGRAGARRRAEARLLGRSGRLRSGARSERHVACGDRAGLFDADVARSRREALSRPRDRLRGLRRWQDLHLQAAREGQVPQWRPAHRGGRQVHLRPPARARQRLFLRLAGRNDRLDRRRRSVDGPLQPDQADRPVPDLHGLPGLLDRAEEALRKRP